MEDFAKLITENPWFVLIIALFGTTIGNLTNYFLKKFWEGLSRIFSLGNTKLSTYLKHREDEKNDLIKRLKLSHEFRVIYAFNIVYGAMTAIICIGAALSFFVLFEITKTLNFLYLAGVSYMGFSFSIGRTKSILHNLWDSTPGKWPKIYKL